MYLVITLVESQKKNKDRLSVYVDGKYSFSILQEDYLRLGCFEGCEITPEDIGKIKNEINFNAAKSRAIIFLSLKVRCSSEVGIKLENEGFDEAVVSNVIDELKSMGYLNDTLFVRKFIHDRSILKPQSKKLLKYELLKKGIEGDIIDSVLSDYELDEETVAARLIKRKFGKYDFKDEIVRNRARNFLYRRGFNSEITENVIDTFTE